LADNAKSFYQRSEKLLSGSLAHSGQGTRSDWSYDYTPLFFSYTNLQHKKDRLTVNFLGHTPPAKQLSG
jgi:hypothetical protein